MGGKDSDSDKNTMECSLIVVVYSEIINVQYIKIFSVQIQIVRQLLRPVQEIAEKFGNNFL